MATAAQSVKNEELLLRGPPGRLLGVVRRPGASAGAVRAALEIPSTLAKTKTSKTPVGRRLFTHFRPVGEEGVCHVRMRLPDSTPPGQYRGEVDLGDRKLPFVAEVQPRPHLQVVPEGVTVEASSKAIEISLTLINAGNVPFEVPRAAAFGLFSTRGLSAAIGESFLAELRQGETRLDRLMEELARSYGGVVKLKVRKGGGRIEAGEARDLDVAMHLPAGLVAGRRYWGDWLLQDAAFRVYVTVPQPELR